jgi:hypothetical protein
MGGGDEGREPACARSWSSATNPKLAVKDSEGRNRTYATILFVTHCIGHDTHYSAHQVQYLHTRLGVSVSNSCSPARSELRFLSKEKSMK